MHMSLFHIFAITHMGLVIKFIINLCDYVQILFKILDSKHSVINLIIYNLLGVSLLTRKRAR